jgi:hypothetical protein
MGTAWYVRIGPYTAVPLAVQAEQEMVEGIDAAIFKRVTQRRCQMLTLKPSVTGE